MGGKVSIDEANPAPASTDRSPEKPPARFPGWRWRHRAALRLPSDAEAEQLRQHRLWIESCGDLGRRADFTGHDFSQTDLNGCDLRGAILVNARLADSNLAGAKLGCAPPAESGVPTDLSGAECTRACFSGVDLGHTCLRGARLAEADFSFANLRGVRGLLALQLARTDLHGADLPESVTFDGMDVVDRAGEYSRNVFLAMLSACVYCCLSIATTTDAGLITNRSISRLPVIGATIPIAGFYIAAPVALLALFIYFNLSLQRLWDLLASLPAIFPDGRPLDQAADPWLTVGLVRSYVRRLHGQRPALAGLQFVISAFLTWWMVPLTVLSFWLRFLRREDWLGTAVQMGVLAVSLALAEWFRRLTLATFRSAHGPDGIVVFRLFKAMPMAAFALILLLTTALSISVISPGATGLIQNRGAKLLTFFRYDPYPDIRGKSISVRPHAWSGSSFSSLAAAHKAIRQVRGARLEGRLLRFARASGSFLAAADLRNAHLDHADFGGAQMLGANLTHASLQETVLANSNLDLARLAQALLTGANLTEADLWQANLSGADLSGAILARTNLAAADLTGANLSGASLLDADLTHATLQGVDVRSALIVGVKGIDPASFKAQVKDYDLALYGPSLLAALGLPPDHNQQIIRRIGRQILQKKMPVPTWWFTSRDFVKMH